MDKRFVWLAGILIILITGSLTFAMFNPISVPPVAIPQQTPLGTPVTPGKATLQGEYVCLPHRDTKGPQTLECALGVKAQDGNYYSLDMSAVTFPAGMINTGDAISVEGNLVPVEALSTDHWQKYNIKGIVRVESVEKL
jgi:hypothetical protein